MGVEEHAADQPEWAASEPADGPRLDAFLLLVLVARRRRLAVLPRVGALVVEVGIGLALIGAQTDPGPPDALAVVWATVLALGAAVLLWALLGAVVARLDRRPEARAAARLQPLRHGPGRLRRGTRAPREVWRLITRRRVLPLGRLTALVVAVTTAALLTVLAVQGWDGAHGRGGPVYTVGRGVTAIMRDECGRFGCHRAYQLVTPAGTVDASSRPRTGQRFTVVGSEAYRVGGGDWLTLAGGAAASLAAGVVLAWLVSRTWRREGARLVGTPRVGLPEALRAVQRYDRPLVLVTADGGSDVASLRSGEQAGIPAVEGR